ncbi:MAG: hypothetical protein KME32_27015 [Mojavia pulchra JT2-VF2]|jgi:hypothetical protein|uniref:Uncharacterized protein n=1 Tax=Mojavia pulchra JT2-VF2 TaxID=287848 RepID=A0A951UIJ0_9NOST|nr:hypothetical protein [Mojavia pulchra JT2-VF2]
MSKFLPVVLAATTVLLASTNHPSTTLAGTCASQCGPRPIQFTPGRAIRLQVINNTSGLVNLEKLQGTKPIPLQPGQEFQIEQGNPNEPNLSLIFWDEMGAPLQAIVSKPNFGTLRLEIRPGNRYPGDRSLYILNDGHVNVY